MSEKFGLDWKEQDVGRMMYFVEILHLEAERDAKNAKKKSPQQEFRKRSN